MGLFSKKDPDKSKGKSRACFPSSGSSSGQQQDLPPRFSSSEPFSGQQQDLPSDPYHDADVPPPAYSEPSDPKYLSNADDPKRRNRFSGQPESSCGQSLQTLHLATRLRKAVQALHRKDSSKRAAVNIQLYQTPILELIRKNLQIIRGQGIQDPPQRLVTRGSIIRAVTTAARGVNLKS